MYKSFLAHSPAEAYSRLRLPEGHGVWAVNSARETLKALVPSLMLRGPGVGGDTTQSLTERAHKLMVMVGSIADFWKVNLRVLFDLETHSSQDHSVGSVSLTVDLGEDA